MTPEEERPDLAPCLCLPLLHGAPEGRSLPNSSTVLCGSHPPEAGEVETWILSKSLGPHVSLSQQNTVRQPLAAEESLLVKTGSQR